MNRRRKVALLLQMFQNFDQGIVRGIVTYARECKSWSIYVEEEQYHWLPNMGDWDGDGVIVNFDNGRLAEAVCEMRIPIVGVGGGRGWFDPSSGIPYVATDDTTIGQLAAEHLLSCGLRHFAFCGYPPTRTNIWIANRCRAFRQRLAQEGFDCHVFNGHYSTARQWNRIQQELVAWVCTLPKPVGLMGCYDWRARHVLEACQLIGLRVPDDVALIGVDNDSMLCELTDPPLSSVEQGRYGIGYTAASLLDKMMNGHRPKKNRYSIPPVGVVPRQSTNLLAVEDPRLANALRLIREQACRGLQADRVAEQIGLSRSTLDTRLKKVIGRTLDLEIRRVRIAQAEELLARTNRPLREVAREAGFGNEQYLSAVVRKETGMTPSQYRRSHQLRTGNSLGEATVAGGGT
jgi:LacI family transcriptional regulator